MMMNIAPSYPLQGAENAQTSAGRRLVTGAELLLQELKRRGVTRVFGVPGREVANIRFTEVEGLEYISARHEFGAGIMAEFTARLTGAVQVCFSTMGPGATNLVTAVASAKLNYSPAVFITAQIESDDRFYHHAHQCVDQRRVLEPVTKWSYELKGSMEIPWAVNRAFEIATREPVGPVHLSVPVDFLSKSVDMPSRARWELAHRISCDAQPAHPNAIGEARDRLNRSKRSIALIGQQAIRLNAVDAALHFCREWNIPYITAANVKGIGGPSDELDFGAASPYMEGILGYDALTELFGKTDLIVNVGYQYVDDLLPKMWEIGCSKEIIDISATGNGSIIGKYKPTTECVGNLVATLGSLSSSVSNRKRGWDIPGTRQRYARLGSERRQFGPADIIEVVNGQLGDDGLLITDIGYYRHHAVLLAKPKRIGQFWTDTGLSSFGSGLPAAIAAQLQCPEQKIYLIAGDGGLMASVGELETASRLQLPMVAIVVDNSAFGLIRLYQQRAPGKRSPQMVELGATDFAKLAEACGWRGEIAADKRTLKDLLSSHDRKRPLLIHVRSAYVDEVPFKESF